MLQIRLSNNKGSASESTGGTKPLSGETVTVACPDHLVLADLPVAKSIGNASGVTAVKIVGRRSRHQFGERVHFCVRCDFPIAIYGRLSPCEHVFCLDCARSDSGCYLCDERIQKIQTIKLLEGIFICAAPHCLKSFLKKSDFESHIQENHADLLPSNVDKEDGNESDAFNVPRPSSSDALIKQSTATDSSTAYAPPRTGFSPKSNSQPPDLEDKSRRPQPREQTPVKQSKLPPFHSRQNNQPEQQQENNPLPVFDRSGPYNRFHPPQNMDLQGGVGPLRRHDSDQFLDKQQGVAAESPFQDYSMHSHAPPNFLVPVNPNQGLAPPFNYPTFRSEGTQQFYNAAPYEIPRSDLVTEGGSEQSSLLGFPPAPSPGTGFQEGFPRPWNMGLAGLGFEPMSMVQGVPEGYANKADSQGRSAFFQGDYRRAPGTLPLQPPLMPKAVEPMQGGSADNKDSKGVLAPEPISLPPPLPRGNFPHSGDGVSSYGWQNEK